MQPASLGDYVWHDANNDGQQNDGAGSGLNGVTVNLLKGDGSFVASTTTANDGGGNPGYYLFANLVPGDYKVEFIKPAGYAFAQKDVGADGSDSDADSSSGLTIATTLSSGENDLSWDAGLVQLASIGDRVWEDTNANGVQDGGEVGKAGVTVELYTCVNDAPGTLVATTTTADGTGAEPLGYYNFSGLMPGDYIVRFIAADGSVLSTANLGGNDLTDSDAGLGGYTACYNLESGENDTSVDAGFYKTASLGDRLWVDTNGDGIQNDGATGISGQTITLIGGGADGLIATAGDNTSATTTTGADGYYNFSGLNVGEEYQVQFSKPAGTVYTGQNLGGDDTLDSDVDVAGLSQIVTLTSGEHNPTLDAGVYTPAQPASIGDRVWLDCDGDGIQDANEVGLGGVTVNLLNGAGSVVGSTTTDFQGNYLFSDLTPGDYAIQVLAPSGYGITARDQGNDDALDSDIDQSTGKTIVTTLSSGENDMNWDAGLTTTGICVDLDLTSNSNAGYGAGNIRTISQNGLVAHASAFSRTDSGGTWAAAYLGSYSGGLGVTDTGEDGSSPNHAVDNVGGRDNYVLFEFDQIVSLDKAYLGWVSGDSDIQIWIGNANDAFNNHLNLSDALLSGMFTEVNTTTSGSARWADVNAGDYLGNVIIIAADTTDMSPEDYFKIQTLSVCTPACGLNASIGDKVWLDSNGNGVQDSGEAGVGGVSVQLLNAAGDVLATTTTDGNGNYLFSDLTPGDYAVQVVAPSGYTLTAKDQGGDDAADSDFDPSTGKTLTTTLTGGENDMSWDAGLKQIVTKAHLGDTVWEDMNYNGIQDAGEAGISGVKVYLRSTAGTVLKTTYTDSQGNYGFDVDAGTYQVQVVRPSGYYATKQDQGGDDGTDSDINGSGYTGLYTVSAGEQNLSIDAGLYKKASVGDKVWDDMNHNNLQDGSEPGISGIKVTLKTSAGTTVASTTTDSNGNYMFSNLKPGDYYLVFDKTNVMHYNYGAWYNMSAWKWAVKDAGYNDNIDSDVTGDARSTTNVTRTSVFNLESGENDMSWDAGITPIAIDLNGDGIQTVSRANSTGTFDLLGNGKAISSGWLSGEDGFLALDRNGNGRVDDISELFGGNNKGDGYAKLAAFDSNGDGVVDADDAAFADLRVWKDANGNHQTDAGELLTMDEAGVASLSLAYQAVPLMDGNGNLHLERGSATLVDGSEVDMTDIYFGISAADVADAGVELPSLADLLSDSGSLDGLVGGTSPMLAPVDCAANDACGGSGLEAMKQLADLVDQQAAYA